MQSNRPRNPAYGEILGLVQKPVRYVGNEWNQIVKPEARTRVGIAFPDSYEIGMSHLGIRILYDLLNRQEDLAAERVFCPAVDMEEALRRFELPLATLETRTPLVHLDVLGFSFQFEMEYTNVLTMLDLGGIPLHTRDRTLDHPLVIAGGPCVFSPEPMADFIDVFVIGDGEEVFTALVRRWVELKSAGEHSREQILAELARIEGLYVPSLYRTAIDPETGFEIVTGPRPGFDVPFPIRRAVVDDINRFPFPTDTVVPHGEIVHDRVSVEIARGCTEGCRFCQAGIIYRPVRERSPEEIIRSATGGLAATGYDEVSLTSLSTADYSCVSSLVKTMMDRFEKDKTAMSVSSMRVYGLTRSIAEQLARVRRTGFTIAPEAGTQRMRDLINKGITEKDIEMAARIAWSQGWTQLKMYFMIGLPTETDEDVLGIAKTGLQVYQLARDLGRRNAKVTVSVSALVPKPHSTFQWEEMRPPDELKRKQQMILDEIRPYRSVKFKYSDVEEGVVECVLSRGDRRLGRVIENAWRSGARFDSWSDHFDYERWTKCMADVGLDPHLFLRRIPIHAALPWDHIDTRVTKQFLVEDLHRGMKGKFSPACEKPFIPRDPNKKVKPLESAILVCYACGLECDLEAIKNERIQDRDSLARPGPEIAAAFQGEKQEPLKTSRESAPIRFQGQPASNGDGLATNAFEAASGTRHGEARGADEALRLEGTREPAAPEVRLFYRVEYAKRGDLRWLSHLDLLRCFQRAFKRAAVHVTYSRGFHPAPLFSFGPALATGLEGAAEILEFETAVSVQEKSAMDQLNRSLPDGIRIHKIRPVPEGSASLSRRINLGDYRAWINVERRILLPEEFDNLDENQFHSEEEQRRWIETLLLREKIPVHRRVKGVLKEIDLRPYIRAIEYRPDEREVQLWLRLGSQGQARPQEVLEKLYGVPGSCFRVRRHGLFLEHEISAASTLEPALP